jgi:hypothetical protein
MKTGLKRYSDIERQNMEGIMKERSLLISHNNLMNNWEKEGYIQLNISEARREIICWKIGVWRLRGLGGTLNWVFFHMQERRKLESHIEI